MELQPDSIPRTRLLVTGPSSDLEVVVQAAAALGDPDITRCTSGEDALRAYGRDGHDIVVLEMDLGDMDAHSLCHRIRAHPEGKRSLLLVVGPTADEASVRSLVGACADDYLARPLDREHATLRLRIAQARIEGRAREARLRDLGRSLQKALDTMQIGVTIRDPSGRIVYANRAEASMHGWEVEDLIGRDVRIFSPPERSGRRDLALGRIASWGRESVNVRKDGSLFPVNLLSDVATDEAGYPIALITTCEDITERKQREIELVRAKEEAERANLAKSQFLANMSHELRTPLNAILGYTEILLEDATDPAVAADLGRVRASALRLRGMIEDVLDVAKLDAGRVRVQAEVFEVGPLVQAAVEAVRPAADRNGNRLAVRIAPGAGTMRSDIEKVRRSLVHILGNACKFTERGSIDLEVDRVGREGGEWVEFRVRDTGPGIPPEERARLFQLFSQVDGSSTRRREGAGLGLVLTRRLCSLLGGDVTVESEPGRGSTFTIRLPAEATEATPS